MGNQISDPKVISRLDRDNWTQVDEVKTQLRMLDECTHLVHKMTGQELFEYDVYFGNQEEFQSYLNSCSFRSLNPELVHIKFLNEDHRREICSFTFHIKVYIERIPLRLSDIMDIPFPENLYVIKNALKGFQILYNKVGAFPISEDLICMTEDGSVKVWVNPNLSKNQIQPSDNFGKGSTQNEMVWNILEFVNDNTDKDLQKFSFLHFVKSDLCQKKLTFTKTLNFLSLFTMKYRISIPKYFSTIVRKVRQEKGIFDSELNSKSGVKFVGDKSHLLSRFKESEVSKFKGSSMNSQSDITYADRLKRFSSTGSQKVHNSGFQSRHTYNRLQNVNKGVKIEEISKKYNSIQQKSNKISQNASIIQKSCDEQIDNNSLLVDSNFHPFAQTIPNKCKVYFSYKEKYNNEFNQTARFQSFSNHPKGLMTESMENQRMTEKNESPKKSRMTIQKTHNHSFNLKQFDIELDPMIAEDLARFQAEERVKNNKY